MTIQNFASIQDIFGSPYRGAPFHSCEKDGVFSDDIQALIERAVYPEYNFVFDGNGSKQATIQVNVNGVKCQLVCWQSFSPRYGLRWGKQFLVYPDGKTGTDGNEIFRVTRQTRRTNSSFPAMYGTFWVKQ